MLHIWLKSFYHQVTDLKMGQQYNFCNKLMGKCTFRTPYLDLNLQPSEHEPPPITTRPGLPPKSSHRFITAKKGGSFRYSKLVERFSSRVFRCWVYYTVRGIKIVENDFCVKIRREQKTVKLRFKIFVRFWRLIYFNNDNDSFK